MNYLNQYSILFVFMASFTAFGVLGCGGREDSGRSKAPRTSQTNDRQKLDESKDSFSNSEDETEVSKGRPQSTDKLASPESEGIEGHSRDLPSIDFEKMPLKDAIKAQFLNLKFDAQGTRAIVHNEGYLNSGFKTKTENVNHNWRIEVPYLGYTRGRANTYLNGKLIDSVFIRLVEGESNNMRKIYRYSSQPSLSNLGRGASRMDLQLVHDRVDGKCFVDFYRYSAFSQATTLGPKSTYEGLEADCPRGVRNISEEVAFTNQKWELTGKAAYDGYLTNSTYEVLARVESYEFAAPWIRVLVGVDEHAFLSYSLNRQASTDVIRVYTYSDSKRRSTFTKNLQTRLCTFTLTDAYFSEGMKLTGNCAVR